MSTRSTVMNYANVKATGERFVRYGNLIVLRATRRLNWNSRKMPTLKIWAMRESLTFTLAGWEYLP